MSRQISERLFGAAALLWIDGSQNREQEIVVSRVNAPKIRGRPFKPLVVRASFGKRLANVGNDDLLGGDWARCTRQ